MKSSNFEKTSYHVSFEGNISFDERNSIDRAVNEFGLSAVWSGNIGDMKCVVSGFSAEKHRGNFVEIVDRMIGEIS